MIKEGREGEGREGRRRKGGKEKEGGLDKEEMTDRWKVIRRME